MEGSPEQPEQPEEIASPAERLERLLLGGEPRYTAREVADRAGVDIDEARRFWRALGFPDTGQERVLTYWDISALRRITGLIRDGVFDDRLGSHAARSLGQTLSRLAEWQVDAVARSLDNERMPIERRREAGLAIAGRVLPDLEELLVYVWRRQLAAVAVGRLAALEGPARAELRQVVGFADLVGFTRLSRSLDAEELTTLVETFETGAADLVAAHGGRLVKTLGDEVLFVANGVTAAAEIAMGLLETLRPEEAVPELRIGMAYGRVLAQMGDVYGTTVNLASRLTTLAKPDTVLISAEFATALEKDTEKKDFDALPAGHHAVRGLGVVESFELRRHILS